MTSLGFAHGGCPKVWLEVNEFFPLADVLLLKQ